MVSVKRFCEHVTKRPEVTLCPFCLLRLRESPCAECGGPTHPLPDDCPCRITYLTDAETGLVQVICRRCFQPAPMMEVAKVKVGHWGWRLEPERTPQGELVYKQRRILFMQTLEGCRTCQEELEDIKRSTQPGHQAFLEPLDMILARVSEGRR